MRCWSQTQIYLKQYCSVTTTFESNADMEMTSNGNHLRNNSGGAVAQPVERPSKVPVWCNSTEVGANLAAALSG